MMWGQALTQVLMFLAPAVVMALVSKQPRAMLHLDFSGSKWLAALVAVVALMLMMPCLDLITEWNDSWGLPHSTAAEVMLEGWLMRTGWGALAANLLVVAITPAICEELFFRCGIQQLFMRWCRRPVLSVVVTAIIFSVAHGEFYAFVPRFVLGLILGMLFMRTGSLLVNMLAHCVNNAVVVVFYWLYANGSLHVNYATEGLSFHWAITAALTVLSLVLFAVVCRYPKFKNSFSQEAEIQ